MTITPAVFERMPWHARARLVSELDAERRRLEASVRRARRDLTRIRSAVHSAAIAVHADPEGPQRLAVLAAEVRAARGGQHHDRRGRFVARHSPRESQTPARKESCHERTLR